MTLSTSNQSDQKAEYLQDLKETMFGALDSSFFDLDSIEQPQSNERFKDEMHEANKGS